MHIISIQKSVYKICPVASNTDRYAKYFLLLYKSTQEDYDNVCIKPKTSLLNIQISIKNLLHEI